MNVRGIFLTVSAGLLLTGGCAPKPAAIEDLRGGADFSIFKLVSVRGARDGDRLKAQAYFSDSSSILTLDLRFRIGTPTALESGVWNWTRNNRVESGTVTARSVTFLGGQNEGPSVGGRFDLLDVAGSPKCRVTIPTTQLKTPTSPANSPSP